MSILAPGVCQFRDRKACRRHILLDSCFAFNAGSMAIPLLIHPPPVRDSHSMRPAPKAQPPPSQVPAIGWRRVKPLGVTNRLPSLPIGSSRMSYLCWLYAISFPVWRLVEDGLGRRRRAPPQSHFDGGVHLRFAFDVNGWSHSAIDGV